MHTPARDTIERLTLRWAASPQQAHLPATHLRVERLLNAVEWQPRGMRPGEILLVRHLRGLPARSDARAWREQLQRRMDDLYRRAARPYAGYIDHHAESVLFRDAAEFLVCLTRDVLDRPSAPAWYWSRALAAPPFSPGARLAALWSTQAEALPAALASFKAVEVQDVVTLLTPQEVARVLHALHSAYALPDTVLGASAPAAETDNDQCLHEEHPASTVPPRSSPPWRALFRPAAQPTLTPPAQYLLGLIVTLRNAPSFARSAAFAQQAAAWLIAENVLEQRSSPHLQTMITASQQRSTDHETRQMPPPQAQSKQGAEPALARTEQSPRSTAQPASPAAAEAAPALAVSNAATAPDALTPAPESPAVFDEPSTWVTEPVVMYEGIATQYGGVLYLINLLTWLGLPGEWENDLGAHLSGWALVEALARALLGTVDEGDALWGILAQLDQRERDSAIGSGFPALLPPAGWRVRVRVHAIQGEKQKIEPKSRSDGDAHPGTQHRREDLTTEAQRDTEEEERRWSCRGEQLVRPLASAYFLPQTLVMRWVLQRRRRKRGEAFPRGTQCFASGQRVNGSLLKVERIPDPTRAALSPALAAWLARLLPFVRQLFARQMPDLSPAELLHRPGRITLSRTHIDLYQPLDQIDLRVRAAGFDRDPAWVPDLGYIILFHFE
jgi:hypothetical protein